MSVQIRGLREFQRWADRVAENVENDVADYIQTTALRMEGEAKRLAPVDTGTLRNSISVEFNRSSGRIEATLGTNLQYAPFVEFGTSRMAARPFMTPVYMQYKNKIHNDLERIVRGGLR